jgi:hypothetical protein
MPAKGRIKKISPEEKRFIECIADTGLGPIEAARKTLGWKCNPGTNEVQRAQDLARTPRCIKYYKEYEQEQLEQAKVERFVQSTLDINKLRDACYERLMQIANDPSKPSKDRYNAVESLRKLADPAKDVGLILRWALLAWRGLEAHCPRCHNDFPLHQIKNKVINDFANDIEQPVKEIADPLDRKLEVLSYAEKRKTPHATQLKALNSKERYVVGFGSARAGKSFLMGMYAYFNILIPGVEIWILAESYDAARKEVEYLQGFLRTAFIPYDNQIMKEYHDSKTGEYTLQTKWGSLLRVRSAKAKGSITGSELEIALVAEPGWVPDNIFHHLLARMSSRLGRLILLGTPQGFGGILGRVVNAIGKDPKTGRTVKIAPEKRTLESGCNWGESMIQIQMDPKDNPEYVQSELESASKVLLPHEYATEFEGKMASPHGAKFPFIKPNHLTVITREQIANCKFVLGVDQGPYNFAWTLLGYDGQKTYVLWEILDQESRTMQAKLEDMQGPGGIKKLIRQLGGDPKNWVMTVFDTDPPVNNILTEMEERGKEWPTDITYKHRNSRVKYAQEDWRRTIYEYINTIAAANDLYWHATYCFELHRQMMMSLDKPMGNPDAEDAKRGKGWDIADKDRLRGDHNADAFVMAMWTIFCGMIPMDAPTYEAKDVWEEHQAAFNYRLAAQEKKDLSGWEGYDKFTPQTKEELWEESFGRPRSQGESWVPMNPSNYKDA